MTPIMRVCANPHYKRVIVVCGSQMGKTEALFNVIGHRLTDDPAPILYLGPTQKLVESYSDGRVMPMLRTTPELWERLAKGKKNKITEKFFAGVRLGFGWAGSPTELAGHPAGLVLVDERDRMDVVKGEGDPVALAEARVATYPDGRVIVASTPTIGNATPALNADTGLEHWQPASEDDVVSPIWRLWQKGTRSEWAWPCPDCGEYFVPRFKLLKWPEGATPDEALELARLSCPHCGAMISDTSKQAMNARGVFVSPGQKIEKDGTLLGEGIASQVASFWISGLCSPWRTFGERASAFLAASRANNQAELQTALNTGLGELYHIGAEALPAALVENLRQGYASATVPEGVQAITAGVDVQKDRLIYAVRGWGFNCESWLIEHGELWGETEYDPVWAMLATAVLDRDWDGRRVMRMLIDSGYRPGEKARNPDNQVYQFCRRYYGRAYPSKGHNTQDRPYRASKIDVSYRGKVIPNGLDLWHLDTDYFKSWIHARLQWPTGQSGGWHLPADATADYCTQIVAETRSVLPSGTVQWVRVHAANHYFDAEVLNAAAALIIGVQTLRPAPAEPAAPPPPKPAPQALRQSNWVTGFRR